MTSTSQKFTLSLADQVLINGLIFCATAAPSDKSIPMVVEIMKKVLGQVTVQNPRIEPLQVAAAQMGGGVFAPNLIAAAAIRDFSLWRLGEAQDAMSPQIEVA